MNENLQTHLRWSAVAPPEGPLSELAVAAVVVATRVLGELRHKDVFAFGSGPLLEAATEAIAAHGPRRIATGSEQDACAKAAPAHCRAAVEADLIVSAVETAAPLYTRAEILAAMPQRRHRPLVLIDLRPSGLGAVAADVGEVGGAYAFDLGDLERLRAVELAVPALLFSAARIAAYFHPRRLFASSGGRGAMRRINEGNTPPNRL